MDRRSKRKSKLYILEKFHETTLSYVIVESKKNNSELVKAVRALQDTENRYIIIFDNSFDNLQIVMEKKRLKKYVNEKENVFLLNIICFEYLLLEFKELIEWIYASGDEFLQKRAKAIAARQKLVESLQDDNFDYKGIRDLKCQKVYLENVG